MSPEVIMTLDRWLRGKPGRAWHASEMTIAIAATKPTKQHTVRLFQSKKTVSIGVGPNRPSAIRDAISNLPKTYR